MVRHGESEGNREGRLQGHRDYPLSDEGIAQAQRLGAWLAACGVQWEAAYSSPLARAAQTAELLRERCAGPPVLLEDDLREVSAGSLEGLTREEIVGRHAAYLERGLTELGDFGEYGGESYDQLQQRVGRLLARLEERHGRATAPVLLVGHGGIHFQLLKALICRPIPKVCAVRMGNCTATKVRVRERRGVRLGEIVWHVPLELMGGRASEGVGALFR